MLSGSMALTAPAQIQQAWVARYNNGITNGTNQAVKMALDSNGNIYVTGFSQNTNTNLGYVTIKYAPNGNQLWASRYDSTNSPSATPAAMVLDSSNDVIVTGSALTVKYDTNGNTLWTAPYAGSALAVDANRNVAVTGFDDVFATVKLNPSGSNLWLQSSPATCGAAMGQAVISDLEGDFYVAGSYPFFCERGLVDFELLIIKYDLTGNQSWMTSYQAEGAPVQVEGVVVDNLDNLYVVSSIYNQADSPFTFKYASNGALIWSANNPDEYFGPDSAHGVILDNNRNLLLSGQFAYVGPSNAYGTFAYGTYKADTNGSWLWTNLFPIGPFPPSSVQAIAVDSANNSYVTGYSPGTNSGSDIVTIKYDPNGNQIWLQRYSSPGKGNAAGNAIAVDKNGNVYVTGYETTAAGGTEIVTIKYSPVTLQRRSDGTVILQAQGSPGESFDIQASTNLLNWLDLGSVLADTNGLMQFDDTNAPAFPSRFYYTSPQ